MLYIGNVRFSHKYVIFKYEKYLRYSFKLILKVRESNDDATVSLDYVGSPMDTTQMFYCYPLVKNTDENVPTSECFKLNTVKLHIGMFRCYRRNGYLLKKDELEAAESFF